ncbi:MAG: hypothetical protein PHP05_03605 [Sideroxydans sp.]|nr:hypothetical protein [Sideroxydans sp.]
MPILKQIFGGLLRLGLLYLLLPFLLADLILIQATVPNLPFQWQPFAVAAVIWMAAFAAVSYRRRSRMLLIWSVVSQAYAGAFFASASTGISGISLLILFTLLAGAINFLYRNRVSESLLVMLPICSAAWSFIVLLYQPCLVAWAVWIIGKQSVLQGLLDVFGNVTTNVLRLAVVVLPVAIMYFLGKHAYLGAYNWVATKLRPKPGEETHP